MMEATMLIGTFKESKRFVYPFPKFKTIPLAFMLDCALTYTVTHMERCVPFQIVSKQLNLAIPIKLSEPLKDNQRNQDGPKLNFVANTMSTYAHVIFFFQ